MNDIEEFMDAMFIGLVVADFLLNTGRVLEAIKICKEGLILINTKAPGKEKQFCTIVYSVIFRIFNAYCVIHDYPNAIKYGRELLVNCQKRGETANEGNLTIILANIYKRQLKFAEARELYERMIKITKETGDRKRQAYAYGEFGSMSYRLGEYDKAKEYLAKALAIRTEIGDRPGEAADYGNLGTVFQSVCEYDKAKEYHEKALAINIEIGDRAGEATCYENLGIVFQSLGEYEKAKECNEKALAINIEIGDRAGEAAEYGNLGVLFRCLGEYDKAKEYMEKALAINIEISDRAEEATCYRNLGTVFQSLGEYDKAKEHHEKALAINIETGDRAGEAAEYGNLGVLFRSLGECDKAKEYLEKALAINIEISDRAGEATCYGNLGTLFHSLGEYDKAKEHHEKALAIRIEIGNRAGEAADYGNLGVLFRCLGEYDKAKEYLEKALTIRTEIGEREGEATDYGNLGTVFQSLCEYDKAKEYLEKALAIRIEIGDRGGEAADYGNLGIVFHSLCKYDKAIEYHEKALAITIKIGDRAGEGASYENLGTVFHSLSEYDKAIEYLEKALAIRIKIGDRQGEANVYGNLGNVFATLGEHEKAKEYLEKAFTIRIEIGDRAGEASCYRNLGGVFQSLGEYEKAKEHYERALAIDIEIGDREEEATDYGKLGTVFQSLGEYDKAKEYYEKALPIKIEIGDREGEAFCYGNLGTVFLSVGEHAMGEDYFERALLISQDIGNTNQEFNFRCSLTEDKLSQGKIDEAKDHLLLGIDKGEDLRGFLRKNDQFKIARSDAYDYPYRNLSAYYCFKGKPNSALHVLELARARALGDLMAAQYSVERQMSANPKSWIGIENTMKKENNCACLYISYYVQNVYLWILKPSGVIHFRDITVNENIIGAKLVSSVNEFLAKSFRCLGISSQVDCENRSLNSSELQTKCPQQEKLAVLRLVEWEDDDDNQEPKPSLPLLYKMFIAPVADLLEEPEIIIVPDRALYQVPFAALIDGSGKYLSETFRIRIVPSLSTLKLIQDSPADYHSQTGALIVGDPVVGRVRYKGRRKNFLPLPCARNEAEMIGKLLGVQPLIGQYATKQAVLKSLHSVSLIHFAAHGDAERGEIALSPLRSTKKIPREEDYLLTMSDISQVQLRAKLVVLSCCHSGCGQIRAEGVIGIARAFLGSGARSVLVALWALDDSATEQLMRCFYEHLVNGESASESLCETMRSMRGNGFPKVSEWAPFMLIGDNVTFDFGK